METQALTTARIQHSTMNPKQDLLNIYQCDRIIFTQEGDSSGLIYLFRLTEKRLNLS